MGLLTETFRTVTGFTQKNASPQLVPSYQSGMPQMMALNYEAFAREGYGGNEIVFAAIEELATSAAEPGMVGKRGKETLHQHPLLALLKQPNPFMGRFAFWATVRMYRGIAGNAYALKVRSASMRPVQLWLLRPDRVRVVPSATKFIDHYQYWLGQSEVYDIPVNDIIHFKNRNPLNDFYGMSPLQVIAPRVDTDNYLKLFVKSYLNNMGAPGGILNIKQKLSPDQRAELRQGFRNTVGGDRVGEVLILDNAEANFTVTTAQLGQRGLVVPELDEINEARLAMPFGVPLSLIGARLGMASSSYGNRKSDRESFWDETLAPLYQEDADQLNLSLVPEFSNIDEVMFDLSTVRALQEDDDKKFTRWGKAYNEGLVPLETAQNKIGLEESERKGMYLIPAAMVPTPDKVLTEAIAEGVQVPPPRLTERTQEPAQPTEGTPKPEPVPAASSNGAKP